MSTNDLLLSFMYIICMRYNMTQAHDFCLALTTDLQNLKDAKQTQGAVTLRNGTAKSMEGSDELAPGLKTLKLWQTTCVGQTVEVNGSVYHWCPKYVDRAGRFNGLYYNYTYTVHDAREYP